jgi:hypothetical protein
MRAMKSHLKNVGLLVLLVLAFIGALTIWQYLYFYLHFYPTPEPESPFLKSYTPEAAIKPFTENWGFSSGHFQGTDSYSHHGGFNSDVVLRPEKWEPLMNALNDDASWQLANSGAQVLSQSGNPHDGFHFDYKFGKSCGSLAILPLMPNTGIRRNHALPKPLEDVTVRTEQTERRCPK